MSCSDGDCPPNKACFVPSCYGSSCRSVQPICLTVLNASDFALNVEESNPDDKVLKVEYNIVNPENTKVLTRVIIKHARVTALANVNRER